MPSVIITLEDSPTGDVTIRSSFTPAVGQYCSPAQAMALEFIGSMQWDASEEVKAGQDNASSGCLCSCNLQLTSRELDSGKCEECGKAVVM